MLRAPLTVTAKPHLGRPSHRRRSAERLLPHDKYQPISALAFMQTSPLLKRREKRMDVATSATTAKPSPPLSLFPGRFLVGFLRDSPNPASLTLLQGLRYERRCELDCRVLADFKPQRNWSASGANAKVMRMSERASMSRRCRLRRKLRPAARTREHCRKKRNQASQGNAASAKAVRDFQRLQTARPAPRRAGGGA